MSFQTKYLKSICSVYIYIQKLCVYIFVDPNVVMMKKQSLLGLFCVVCTYIYAKIVCSYICRHKCSYDEKNNR